MLNKILNAQPLTFDEILDFATSAQLEILCETAEKLRRKFLGNTVDTCSIMNAKSGRCSENCKWCAQSAHHNTGCGVYAAVSAQEAFECGKKSHELGIRRFSLVTSGRTLSDADTQKMADAFKKLSTLKGLYLCGSFGLLTKAQFEILRAAGMRRFHCNLETAPSYFPKLCSTHTMDDKIASIRAARETGLSICSGGIIGMGESFAQRVELAHTLATLGVDSIPVNVLQPIKGTPLENTPPLPREEILRSFAVFRIANPRAHIRFAGGRSAFRDFQETALKSGASAILMGDMLTTVGSGVAEDFEMLKRLGYDF